VASHISRTPTRSSERLGPQGRHPRTTSRHRASEGPRGADGSLLPSEIGRKLHTLRFQKSAKASGSRYHFVVACGADMRPCFPAKVNSQKASTYSFHTGSGPPLPKIFGEKSTRAVFQKKPLKLGSAACLNPAAHQSKHSLANHDMRCPLSLLMQFMKLRLRLPPLGKLECLTSCPLCDFHQHSFATCNALSN
jgi:hypothetical protein